MTVSQVGIFEHGTAGFTVRIQLGASNIGIAWATQVNIKVKRPSEADYGIDRNLTTGAIIDDVVGVVGWPLQDGDIPVIGTYELVVTITGPSTTLVVDGTMKVT
jgi:hypothetical protein